MLLKLINSISFHITFSFFYFYLFLFFISLVFSLTNFLSHKCVLWCRQGHVKMNVKYIGRFIFILPKPSNLIFHNHSFCVQQTFYLINVFFDLNKTMKKQIKTHELSLKQPWIIETHQMYFHKYKITLQKVVSKVLSFIW